MLRTTSIRFESLNEFVSFGNVRKMGVWLQSLTSTTGLDLPCCSFEEVVGVGVKSAYIVAKKSCHCPSNTCASTESLLGLPTS
jgi:hypothetical protein